MKPSINYQTITTIIGLSNWIIETSGNTRREQLPYSFTNIDGNHGNKDGHVTVIEPNLRNTQLNGIPPFNCSLPHQVNDEKTPF